METNDLVDDLCVAADTPGGHPATSTGTGGSTVRLIPECINQACASHLLVC